MVEAGAKEISEDIVLKAVKFAHEANQDIIRLQEELQRTSPANPSCRCRKKK